MVVVGVGIEVLLLSISAGVLGTWIVLRGLAFFSHAVATAAFPGLVLATVFVSLPFVVREVVPVLREIGTEQEQAASTLGASAVQIFRRVTLPAIRWGVVYGVVLTTARCLGEFGAVSVISGNIAGKTETMTQYVDNQYEGFNVAGAYAASVVLALLSVVTLVLMTVVRRKEEV